MRALSLALLLLLPTLALAQAYPTKPIRFIVGFPPGGSAVQSPLGSAEWIRWLPGVY